MDVIDISEADQDMLSCDILEHFKTPFKLTEYKSVGLDDTYVLNLSVNNRNNILAGMSNQSITVYDGLTLNKVVKKHKQTHPIIDLKFSPSHPDMYYTGSHECVQLWDMRTQNEEMIFDLKENVSNGHEVKPLTTFDINKEDEYLTAGTEVVSHDAFVVFWDVRGKNLLGGYWETLGDDVTVTKFSPTDPNRLVTASSDGQVNVFDISQQTEDEALVTSLNAEAAVRSVTYMKDNSLAFILDHEEVILWKIEDSEPYKTFNREDFTVAIKRKVTPWTYVAGCHYDDNSDKTYFLAGSSYAKNPCLRVLNLSKAKLKPFGDLNSGPKAINTTVRCSALAQDGATFVTGSEDGLICVWSVSDGEGDEESVKLKASKKAKKAKKPYNK